MHPAASAEHPAGGWAAEVVTGLWIGNLPKIRIWLRSVLSAGAGGKGKMVRKGTPEVPVDCASPRICWTPCKRLGSNCCYRVMVA